MTGKFNRHVQLCQQASVVRCDVPSVPASLLEAYHGCQQEDDRDVDFSGGDDVVYDNAVDLPYMADMFHDPPAGQHERPFDEIFLEMMENPEAVYEPAQGKPSNDRFQKFQQALVYRGNARNPYNFRNASTGEDMNKLLNIYAFVRKYTLSMSAGEFIEA